MSKKNRIEQPYGYREQNEFTSEPAMICDAINGISGGGGDEELIEKVNTLLNKAFISARYEDEKFIFSNSYEADVDSVKFPFIVDTATYDADTNKIIVTFKDDNADPIEVSLEDLVGEFNDIVEEEAESRASADTEIWNAIGDLSGSTQTSGKTIIDMINEEISARTSGDSSILDALNEEILSRTEGDELLDEKIQDETAARMEEDQRIIDMIGDIGASGSNFIRLIEEETSARTEGDNELWEALSAETEERKAADEEILASIGEIGDSSTTIVQMIETEIAERTSADTAIWEALNAEIEARTEADANEESARTEADNSILSALNDEISQRVGSDETLNTKIDDEISAREQAVFNEASARAEMDELIDSKVDQEKVDRAAADGELEGKISVEKTERETADNELDSKIAAEKAARIFKDNALSGAVDTEIENREAEDGRLWDALSAESAARQAEYSAITGSIQDNQVSIVKVDTALPSNVKEAYELKNATGAVLGARINIYKDSSLKNVELVDEYEGRQGQFLKFTYILDDGSETDEYVDVSKFLVEAEFKDGLTVNNSGQVKVKIDYESEDYITVSPNGVKISGVDEIKLNLLSETIARQNADTNLEALITNEATVRQNADNGLTTALTEETETREAADTLLNTRIADERSARMSDDALLETKINNEISERESSVGTLTTNVINLRSDLDTEVNARRNNDNMLQTQVDTLKNADIDIRDSIATTNTNLANEISARSQGDIDLQLQVNQKANSVDVYYKNEVDSIFAKKTEIPTDFYSKSEVDSKDAVLNELIADETSARLSEDISLNSMIINEANARVAAVGELQNEINSIETELSGKVDSIGSSDLVISVDNSNPTNPKIKANVSEEEDQIIKINSDGLYAKATLDYDIEDNELIFSTSNAETKRIKLQTKSEINTIYYDATTEEIVIEYTVNGQRKEDVRVPVGDLIDEWRVEDGNVGAIALNKERLIGSDQDVLSARLVLNTTHGDNAAVIDANALYVSKSAITADVNSEIEALKERVAALEQALQMAEQVHESQSDRISAAEEKNESQDDIIAELQALMES